MSIEVEVVNIGWEDVINTLEYVEIALPNEITVEEIKWILAKAKEVAQLIVPVKTGELRDSIDFTVNESEKTGSLFATAGHGPYVELGTSRMQARPFLVPAMFQVLAEFEITFYDRLHQVIEKR